MFDVSRLFTKQPGRIAGLAVQSLLPPGFPRGQDRHGPAASMLTRLRHSAMRRKMPAALLRVLLLAAILAALLPPLHTRGIAHAQEAAPAAPALTNEP